MLNTFRVPWKQESASNTCRPLKSNGHAKLWPTTQVSSLRFLSMQQFLQSLLRTYRRNVLLFRYISISLSFNQNITASFVHDSKRHRFRQMAALLFARGKFKFQDKFGKFFLISYVHHTRYTTKTKMKEYRRVKEQKAYRRDDIE